MAFSMKIPAKKTPQASSGKQYGLILPTKKEAKKDLKPAASAFFSGDAEDEAPADKATERRRVGVEAARSFQQSKVEKTHEKALAEDASVFDYDGVYDDMQRSRNDKKSQRKAQREAEKQSSKYIGTLMEKAKVREIEHERIRERRLLKERETEDEMYGDKEKLISASYKRKLQDLKRWDEEDKRMEKMEAAEDVTKRGGDAMAGFYSNLLTKNLAMGGDAKTHSRSAYTVGRESEKNATKDETESTKPRDDRGEAVDERVISVGVETPASKKTKLETDREEESSEKSKTAVKHEEPARAEPAVPKEEVISAARARFLARKAAREQQQPSSQA